MTQILDYRDTTYVPAALCRVNGYDVTNLMGYDVEEYDLSYDAGRQANGVMRLNYVRTCYKIILKFQPMFKSQAVAFFSHLPRTAFDVYFFNPYTGNYQTISCYRGDRAISLLSNIKAYGQFYDSIEQSLIQL